MKIIVLSEYRNDPHGIRFETPGTYEVDPAMAEFLLRDAPENFGTFQETTAPEVIEGTAPPSAESGDAETAETLPKGKAFDKAPKDTAIKSAPKQK